MLGHFLLHQQRFRWDIRKNFLTETGVKHQNRLPRAVVPGSFQKMRTRGTLRYGLVSKGVLIEGWT